MKRRGIREAGEEIALDVRLTPRASRNEIAGWDDEGRLRVKVTAPPVDGAANRALRKLLAKRLGVSSGSVTMARGETSRHKTLHVRGLTILEVERALNPSTGRNEKGRS